MTPGVGQLWQEQKSNGLPAYDTHQISRPYSFSKDFPTGAGVNFDPKVSLCYTTNIEAPSLGLLCLLLYYLPFSRVHTGRSEKPKNVSCTLPTMQYKTGP